VGALNTLPLIAVKATFYAAPLILVLWIGRRRVNATDAGLLLAAGFAAATGLALYGLDWPDAWRYGSLVGTASYALLIAGFAVIGWTLGSAIVRSGKRRNNK
jgi:hypothetical protein